MENTVYHVTLFGLEFDIDRVAFTLPIGDGWPIYWYGILIAIGFLLALLYALKRANSFGVNPDRMIDVVLVAAPVGILGARAFYIAFDPKVTFADFFNIHNGGLAIYGGIIFSILAGALMCKLRKVNFLSMLDLASLGFLIGQCIGRWGNFFNQEAYGVYTNSSWWGMTSDKIQAENLHVERLVHPCFLYESLWCLLGFILLHILSKHRKFKGEIFLAYTSFYGLGRFFIEGLRTDSLMLGSMRVSQIIAAAAFVAGGAALLYFLHKSKKRDIPTEYTPMFDQEITGMGEADEFDGEIQMEESDPVEPVADRDEADEGQDETTPLEEVEEDAAAEPVSEAEAQIKAETAASQEAEEPLRLEETDNLGDEAGASVENEDKE